ncbi:MAG: hypothetical protein KatS3mg125_0001 [Lysobacterales bacterium]|jgi:hypothetical protein|nr:MAG: hypothetical protein KatS3mg125_0001 [Xanthomonadales bacterium]
MLYLPVQPDFQPILRVPHLPSAWPEDFFGDLAVDIRDLLDRTLAREELELLRQGRATGSIYIWYPAHVRVSMEQLEYWQELGFAGLLFADFDEDDSRLLRCWYSFFGGIVFARHFARRPDDIWSMADFAFEDFGRKILMILDHEEPLSTEGLTHVRAYPPKIPRIESEDD